MKHIVILFALTAGALRGAEISNEKIGFKITFPDSPGWSPPEHQSQGDEIQSWSAANQAAGQALNVTAITAAMPGAKPTFKEIAAEWERGVMTRFSNKTSSRFTSLAGHEAFQLDASARNEQGEIFTSNWMVQMGDTTFSITIAAKESAALSGAAATSFLNSLRLAK